MANYFRITAYHPEKDFSAILDSYGRFEKLWEFSAYLIAHNFKIIEVAKGEILQHVNFDMVEEETNKILLRSIAPGRPETQTAQGKEHKYMAIRVGNYLYGQIVFD